MRWDHPLTIVNPKPGDLKIVKTFLWCPKTLWIYGDHKEGDYQQTRWLEYTDIRYIYKERIDWDTYENRIEESHWEEFSWMVQ